MSTVQPRLKRERKRSREIFERAEKVLVGGVNSPVRAFRSVGGEPLIIERGSGQHLYDADGNELLDYVCSWGAMILGHANPAISEAIADIVSLPAFLPAPSRLTSRMPPDSITSPMSTEE